MSQLKSVLLALVAITISVAAAPARGQQQTTANPLGLLGDRVIKINKAISMVAGTGNTFVVATSEGNVVIDTSNALLAQTLEAGHGKEV